jgi:hypothetical protein
MRVSRLVSAPNWRYALGEVALIVVGVTIALAGTSWYEGRQDRRDEILILQQIHQTLSEDLQRINTAWEFTRRREESLTSLVAHLESDLPYLPELSVKFQALLGWRIVRINTAPYEALKIRGYELISNAKLRERLISLYEDHFGRLQYNLDLDRDFAIEKVQPYFFRNFVMHVAEWNDVDGGRQDWVPIDYDKMKAEAYIANLCRFRADLLRRFALPQYGDAAAIVQEILDEIEKELTIGVRSQQ